MFFYSFTFILAVVCAVFFYRSAEFEGSSGTLWSGLSILVSVLVIWVLHWGFLGVLLGQVGLFSAITLFRVMRKD